MQNRRGKGGLLECCKKEDEEKMVPLSGCFIRKRRGEKKSPYDGGGSQTVWGPVHDKQFLRSGIIRIGSSAARCSNRTCLVHVFRLEAWLPKRRLFPAVSMQCLYFDALTAAAQSRSSLLVVAAVLARAIDVSTVDGPCSFLNVAPRDSPRRRAWQLSSVFAAPSSYICQPQKAHRLPCSVWTTAGEGSSRVK